MLRESPPRAFSKQCSLGVLITGTTATPTDPSQKASQSQQATPRLHLQHQSTSPHCSPTKTQTTFVTKSPGAPASRTPLSQTQASLYHAQHQQTKAFESNGCLQLCQQRNGQRLCSASSSTTAFHHPRTSSRTARILLKPRQIDLPDGRKKARLLFIPSGQHRGFIRRSIWGLR